MSVQLISTDQRRSTRFTSQQKLQILKEWEATGDRVDEIVAETFSSMDY